LLLTPINYFWFEGYPNDLFLNYLSSSSEEDDELSSSSYFYDFNLFYGLLRYGVNFT